MIDWLHKTLFPCKAKQIDQLKWRNANLKLDKEFLQQENDKMRRSINSALSSFGGFY